MSVKRRTVYSRTGQIDPERGVVFAQEVDEGERPEEVFVFEDVFADMGEPDTITVTVEPGDKLNPPKRKAKKKAPAKKAVKGRTVKKTAAKSMAKKATKKRPAGKKAVKGRRVRGTAY